MKKILKEKDPTNTNLASQVSLLKLAVNLSELYNLRALKMDKLITWRNIDKLETQARRNIGYFRRLRKAQLARKEAGYVDWATSFIHKDTYNIMRISFYGYFAYARYLIDLAANTPKSLLPADVQPKLSISPAQFTTSFIEA